MAQVIIDNFITSAYSKWEMAGNLVMLLPHGYEGQGPEHSSARFERYLSLCAEDNITVCNITTPAQYYHVLRRQVSLARPLIIMTPKSLLRLPAARSTKSELLSTAFEPIVDDMGVADRTKIDRVLFCTGKLYYDLLSYREQNKMDRTAIVRVEQLYPFEREALQTVMDNYAKSVKLIWVQEEPKNMGAWTFMNERFSEAFGTSLLYVGRPRSASTATGMLKRHLAEQHHLVEEAFTV